MEGRLVARESGTRPRMAAEMERVLMSFGFVLVLEALVAVSAKVLLFHLMCPVELIRVS